MSQRMPAIEKPLAGPHIALEVGRLAALVVVTVLLQTVVASNIRVMGANPDFALLVVVAVALLRGAEVGAVFGFVTGGFVSLALFVPPGVESLVLVVVGFLAGRYAETADLSPSVAPIFAVFAGTLVAETLTMLTQFLFGRQVPIGYLFGHWLIPLLVLNTLLAVPFYAAGRWWLKGARHVRLPEA